MAREEISQPLTCLDSSVWNLVLTGTDFPESEELSGTQQRPGEEGIPNDNSSQ